jgi:hypothetical protein
MQDQAHSGQSPHLAPHRWVWGLDDWNSTMAARTETDPTALASMVEDMLSGKVRDDSAITPVLLGNRKLPFASLEKLAKARCTERDFYRHVLQRADATPEALDRWADSADLFAVGMIARHPNAQPETLLKLLRHPDPLAPFLVITSRRLPQDVVDRFAASGQSLVRRGVAKVSANLETLRKLAIDSDEKVRLAVARNSATEAAIIGQLARQDPQPSPEMGRAFAQRLDDPQLLAALAAHDDAGVRLAVARNPRTPTAALAALARKERRPGPALCQALQKRLADPELVQLVTRNASPPPVRLICQGTNPLNCLRHTYTIIMEPAPRGRTTITIAVKGTVIGRRTTILRHLFVAVCCPNWGYHVARLEGEIPQLLGWAELYERVHQQVPGALAELDRASGIGSLPAAVRAEHLASREKAIADGRYAERAASTRAQIAKAEADLRQLWRGPRTKLEKPVVTSWHERREYVRRPRPEDILLEVLEIWVP